MQTPAYSTLFSCIYDQPESVGCLGYIHYSVFRSIEWLNVSRKPLEKPQIHDFAVIWDGDHDTRVIQAIESIYMDGLLSPIQFIGEHKGELTIIVATKYRTDNYDSEYELYVSRLKEAAQIPDDCWHVQVGTFDRSPMSQQIELKNLLGLGYEGDITFLRHIDALWKLGTKDYQRRL
ncbi:MAG: hypothetical protein EOP48_33955, partial [Sphingobacteriales bacterium]